MRIKKNYVIGIFVVILLLIFNIVLGYKLIQPKTVSTENDSAPTITIGPSLKEIIVNDKSQNFEISFEKSELLNKYLEEWNFWEENSVSINNISKNSISTFEIELTDQPQKEFVLTYNLDKNPPDIYASYNWQVVGRTFKAIINLEPGYHKSFSEKELDLSVTYIAILMAYNATHRSEFDSGQDLQPVLNALNEFRSEKIPFVVKHTDK